MSKLTKRLLTVVLSVMMLSGSVMTTYASTMPSNAKTASGTRKSSLTVQPVDPDSLDVAKLGDSYPEPEDSGESAVQYADDDIVRVSIQLSKDSVISAGYKIKGIAYNKKAVSYRKTVSRQQNNVTRKIEAAIGSELDVVWNLTLAANIISANVRYGDIEKIKKVSGVVDVFLENRYEAEKDSDDPDTAVTSEYMTGASQAWALGYTGAGSKIAIIDTGTNQDHISFDPDALVYALTEDGKSLDDYDLLTLDDIRDLLDQLNANNNANKHYISSAEEAYKNVKIPFAFNYIDGNYVTDHYSDEQGEHGSHVSGIAAANRYIKKNGVFVDAAKEVYAVGMAPDAQILTMKVFGKGGGAYDSDYMAAIEDAIILGADAVNLSLGSPNGFSFSGGYESIMNSLVNSGMVATMSGGNNYAWTSFLPNHEALYADDVMMDTAGSPGAFINSLSVAAAQNIGGIGSPLVFNGEINAFYTETDSTGARMNTIAGTYEYVYIDGVGNTEEYEAVNAAVSLEGKVILINRGSISFYVKGNNAIKYNPKAMVVVNNSAGTINMALDDYTGTFPMVAILKATGQKIKNTSTSSGTAGGYTYYTGTIEVTNTVTAAVETDRADAEVTEFSSWGVPSSLLMKPEITAPGGNIWSVNGMTNDEYEDMSGTSMSAPHMAGLVGVVAQYIEDAGLEEKTGLNKRTIANSLMMSTAWAMKNEGRYVPILQQGSGLADVYQAVTARSLIIMDEDATVSYADGKVKAELGQDAQRTGNYEYSFNLTNLSETEVKYDLKTDLFTQDLYVSDEDGKTYMSQKTRDLSATVKYDWIKNTNPLYDVDKDGDTDSYDVQAILDYMTGVRKAEDVDLEKADFDGDGRVTSADARKLLVWLQENPGFDTSDLTIKPGETVKVTVKISLTDDEKKNLNKNYEGGAYIEGFTYITSNTITDEGLYADPGEYSIPILGFYGSWT
ncbi:MAG: S8 family serine peptidase, partial [Erysipelotrichaceae bacterium]|nr:S8 family serine peptidase [Erysipelotrichaceae bacterium]